MKDILKQNDEIPDSRMADISHGTMLELLPEPRPLPDKKLVTHSIGELYCGPGGFGIGASMAEVDSSDAVLRLSHSWATDLDEDSCNTYRQNLSLYNQRVLGDNAAPDVFPSDVRELDLSELPAVDGLVFGFPCNDFSIVGEKLGMEGEFGPLYSYGVQILRLPDQPKWFMAENVSGIRSSDGGDTFRKILFELEGSGYTLTVNLYKFEEYGIPQARHRVVIVGIRNDLGLIFNVPAPNGITATARDALEGIPDNCANNDLTKQHPRVVERLKHIKPGQNAWNSDLPEHLKLNVPNTRLSHIYKRLDPDKPAYTVTGSGGGGTHMYHWEEPRALTNRERARIQTFPDWFVFEGKRESVRKQIGMAIPVQASKMLFEAVLKTFAGVEYDSVPPNMDSGLLL